MLELQQSANTKNEENWISKEDTSSTEESTSTKEPTSAEEHTTAELLQCISSVGLFYSKIKMHFQILIAFTIFPLQRV